MSRHMLGLFDLQFELSGKLGALSFGQMAPFLADSFRREDLGNGYGFETRGWDECFPTIEPCGDSPVLGDLLWSPPVLTGDSSCVCQAWDTKRWRATRRFNLDGTGVLVMEFSAWSRSAVPLPYLWASHTLFRLGGLKEVRFADGFTLQAFELDGSSSKTFRRNTGPIRMTREDGEIILSSDQPWWGVWYNRGGWPAGRPEGVGALGLEATTTESDHPGATVMEPGGSFHGTVRLECRPFGGNGVADQSPTN